MKKIILASIILLTAGSLPAAAQTFQWDGGFNGHSAAGSAVTGGFAFGSGSVASGSATTSGWADGSGRIVGAGGTLGHFSDSLGVGKGYYSSGVLGQSVANAQSGTGLLGGGSSGMAFGSTSGSAVGGISLRP